jgi:hypothetical protein
VTDLERALVSLGVDLDVPDAPDVAPAVLARLRRERRPRPRVRPALVVALALLAVLAAALAIPEARSTLLRVLHLGAERIERVDELPDVRPRSDLELVLGEPVSLAEARRRSGFELRELDDTPSRVYLGDRGTVWFLYGTPDRVKLLLAQTSRLRLDTELVLKKLVGPETSIEQVDVDGWPGFFVHGEPHLVLLLDENGDVVEDSARLARNVLLWQRDGITYRIEGDFDEEVALALARGLH